MESKSIALLGTLVVGVFLGAMIGISFVNGGTTATSQGVDTEFILEAYLSGYVGVSDNIKGEVNPDLKVPQYSEITIILRAGEVLGHNLLVDEYQDDETVISSDGPTEIIYVFSVEEKGILKYYCSIPGHEITMNGRLIVGDVFSKPISPAQDTTVDSIVRHPNDIPSPVGARTATNVSFTIYTTEVVAEIEPGTTFTYWTFNSTVPGPLLRVRVGDNVTINLVNPANSTQTHSIDLHAVTDNGGGAAYTQAAPGTTESFYFNASHEGAYVYHCATPHIPTHISVGMFGAISVEPVNGLSAVDKEFYVGQSEVYTKWEKGTAGHQAFDSTRLLDENPNYVLFNGMAGSLTDPSGLTDPAFSLNATKDDNIRIFFAVGGPNIASNFHIIGEILDKVYYETSGEANMIDAETVVVPPGSVIMIEMNVEKVGRFLLVDHALSRTFDKGSLGFLYVNP